VARLAWIVLACALGWWFAFDRVWPRLSPGVFARVELGLLVAACLAAALAWRREPSAPARAGLGVALAGLALYGAVVVLHLRFVP